MIKYRLDIVNLDCPNCAKRIEDYLNSLKEYKNVRINFNTSKIIFESDKEISIKELNKHIKKIEKEVRVISKNEIIKKEYHLLPLIMGTLLGIIGLYLDINVYVNKILIIASYLLLLYKPFVSAIKMFINTHKINENFLIVLSCLGAYFVDNAMEGMMVVILYLIGKILEEKAVSNSRRSIKDLMDLKQDYANKKVGKDFLHVDVEEIEVGDVLLIKKGEKVPVDGVIIEGHTILDMKSLTGEVIPNQVNLNDEVLSGSINIGDIIKIKVTNKYEDSTVSRILELVEVATDKKTKTETIVSRFSSIYTPSVLGIAILLFIIFISFTNLGLNDAIYRALTFLVISCPCAIAISVPLSYFTGIGIASKNGILIKGSNYLDNLMQVNKIIFDKTGTLTTGIFTIKDIEIIDNNYQKEEIMDILIKGESLSNHPIAKSITNNIKDIDNKDISNFKEIEGEGISFEINKKIIKVGTKKICKCEHDSAMHFNVDGHHVASIIMEDTLKDNISDTIIRLKKRNIKTYMFTGDKKDIALGIGRKVNIENIKYEMLPTDKYREYELIKQKEDMIIFVGDGINDAPVLKRADIGISMGNIGSSSAIEASDIVLMNDDVNKITKAIDISRFTSMIIKQNLIFAILTKVLILVLSIFGLTTMLLAVFADTGVTLLTIINTIRIRNKFN